MERRRRAKVKYRTLSIPDKLAEKVDELIRTVGFWPSVSAFTREAVLEKIEKEQRR